MLVLASLLIVLGVTDKGKQILAVLLGKYPTSSASSKNDNKTNGLQPEKNTDGTIKKFSGDADIPAGLARYPGAYVGERGAGKV
jgi:hypothetical protein